MGNTSRMTTTSKSAFVQYKSHQADHSVRSVQRSRQPLFNIARCMLPVVALALGWLSLTTAKESAIGQYGLIQALPPLYFISLAILAVSFILSWRSPQPRSLEFILSVTILVLLLQSAPGFIESEPRFAVAWIHAGFTNFVAQTGRVLPNVDARFSWPSFFTGMALLDRTGGLPNAIMLIRWWPVFINLLYLPPLYLLSTLLLHDKKKVMLAVWLFPLANWVGQDYYSPQSVAYLLYLVFLCVVLGPCGANRRVMIRRRRKAPQHGRNETTDDEWHPQSLGHAITLLLVMLVLCAAIDTGHQLTPIFAVATVAVLVFFGRTRLLAWPGVMFLLAAGWVCYAAIAYWSGHFATLFGSLGSVGSNYSSDLRLRGDAAHSQIDDVRLLIFGGIWVLAFIGFFVGRKINADRKAAIVIMVTPLFMIAGQSYGGEAGLRAFLFSLPGALCLASMALTSANLRVRLVLTSALIAVLIPGFLIARWGNELSEFIRSGEISGMNALYQIAQPGSTIMSITPEIAWQYTDVGQYQYAPDNLSEFAFGTVSAIATLLKNPHGGYVIITQGQLEYAEAAYGLPINWGSTVEQRLAKSHMFHLVYSNPEAKVYKYIGPS